VLVLTDVVLKLLRENPLLTLAEAAISDEGANLALCREHAVLLRLDKAPMPGLPGGRGEVSA
jgi:hypothetical protein